MKLRRTSRITPALAAVLLLAACGDSSSAPPDTGPGSSSPGDEAGAAMRAPTPVEVVGGGASPTQSAATAESAGADVATSDMMIAPWVVEYVVGDGMPGLPADDTGYVFESPSGATADQVAGVAAAFGVVGEPIRFDDGFGVSWRVGPDDGSAPSLWVSGDGMASWNYNAPWDVGGATEVCAVSVDPDGNETSDCPEPEPPVGVPTAAEAEARARDLLVALGVDPDQVVVETFADEWFAGVDATDGSDGRAPIRSWNFGFGAEGVLQYASGSLVDPQAVGPYPLVDLDTAVARLNEGWYGGLGGVAMAEPAIAVESAEVVATVVTAVSSPDEPVSEEPVSEEPVSEEPVSDEPVSDEPVSDEPLPEPMPVEPPFDGEPVVVTLVDVAPDLWWAWDADGSVWLLPAYRFIDADGGWYTVPAVTDEFLIVVEPSVVVDPLPVEPGDGTGGGAEPLPAPETLPAPEPLPEPDPGPKPDVPPPGVPDAIDEVDPPDLTDAAVLLEQYVGLSIEEFTAEAGALGFDTRVVRQDGEPLAVTADYSETRVNVAVEGPRVVAIEFIG